MKIQVILSLFLALLMFSCDDDDANSDGPTGRETSYTLFERAVDGISGMATFIENGDATTTIRLELTGTPAGGSHPAHIHFNTAAEGGAIALDLGVLDGTTGMLELTTDTLSDGTAITYDQLNQYDGYINVHFSADDLGTIVAQGDIGQNVLTGESVSYTLNEKDAPGISGTVMFEERQNGEALATIALTGTPAGGSHPAHIHAGSVATAPGGVDFTFNPVNGDTGVSLTNVSALDDGTAISYSDILTYDGYVNVHLSASELGVIVAQGNIGAN